MHDRKWAVCALALHRKATNINPSSRLLQHNVTSCYVLSLLSARASFMKTSACARNITKELSPTSLDLCLIYVFTEDAVNPTFVLEAPV